MKSETSIHINMTRVFSKNLYGSCCAFCLAIRGEQDSQDMLLESFEFDWLAASVPVQGEVFDEANAVGCSGVAWHLHAIDSRKRQQLAFVCLLTCHESTQYNDVLQE